VKPDRAPSTALVAVGQRDSVNVWDDVRLQKLWLGVDRKDWRSLAVLGTSRNLETLEVAGLLAQLAWRYRGQPSRVFDLRDLSMRLLDYEVQEMRAQLESGMRLVIPLRSIFENPTAGPIARQADATLICIALGESSFKAADETIAAVGRDRIIGAIVLRPRTPKAPSRSNGG
jgi:hypothetical protein